MGAGFTVNMIQRGAVSLGRVNEILKTMPSIKDPENPALAQPGDALPALELSGLSFSYNGGEAALDNISLNIKRGEWLGIMGRTGSGKSTLIKTFTRMLDPPAGTVRIFGLDVREWPLDDLRKLFAVSPQDSYLFSDSIQNNIAYGLAQDDPKLTARAVEASSLEKDLAAFNQGGETLIGERGLTLSGGQKQRTAIARALTMNSEFLILDDSLSAVDNETERKILEALLRERKGKTTIIISHRVSTLRYADKVLVLDKGKMNEYGNPAQLASSGGFYSRMAAFQRLEPQPLSGEGSPEAAHG
jgi:ATP-binding cassette subfamily B protein